MTKHVARNRKKLLLLAAGWIAVAVPAAGQTSAAPNEPVAQSVPVMPKYDVATVKPNVSGSGVTIQDAKPDIVRLENTSVFWMLRMVYGLAEEQIVGAGLDQVSSHYDVVAKMADEDVPMLRQIPMMQRFRVLQPLLEERFGLKYHYEARQLYAYTITVAKGGPKLKAIEPIFDEKARTSGPMGYRLRARQWERWLRCWRLCCGSRWRIGQVLRATTPSRFSGRVELCAE